MGVSQPTRQPNLHRARSLMEEAGVDALLAVGARNVYYLSGLESDWLFDVPMVAAAILPFDEAKPATLIVHDVELSSLAERPSWMPGLKVYRAEVCGETFAHYTVGEDSLDARERQITDLMAQTDADAASGLVPAIKQCLIELGLEKAQIASDEPRLGPILARDLPALHIRDESALFRRIRLVKTDAEITLMREAARRNHAALADTLGMIRPGVTWQEIERAYAIALAQRDCRFASFYVGAGRRSGGLQAHGNYEVQTGDQACFDAMMTFHHYHADMQRTAVLGTPSGKVARYWNALSKGVEAAYDAMGPNVSTAELRRIALDVVRSNGIADFRHAFVHGLGLDHIELPLDSAGFPNFVLEPGMIVNMDMEVCEIGFGGIYFEDSMLITATGAEPLLASPWALIHL